MSAWHASAWLQRQASWAPRSSSRRPSSSGCLRSQPANRATASSRGQLVSTAKGLPRHEGPRHRRRDPRPT
eukprot:6249529-Pyramimonas_sp.AAC.1